MRVRVFAACVALLASALLLPVPMASADPVDVKIASAANAPVLVELLQVEASMGRNIDFFFRIQNLSGGPLGAIEVAIDQQDAKGRTRAHHSFVQIASLESGEELYVSRQVSSFRPNKSDTFTISVVPATYDPTSSAPTPDVLARNELGERFAISTCTTYCDKCADRALALCGSGTSEYDCSCSETTASCSFKCRI